jgi:hypothetical protein
MKKVNLLQRKREGIVGNLPPVYKPFTTAFSTPAKTPT